MARNISNAVALEVAKGKIRPAVFAELQFTSGTVYFWSGIGTKTWNGNDWLGVGTLGAISSISESTEVRADGIVLALVGVPAEVFSADGIFGKVVDEIRLGKTAKIYLGFLNEAGDVIADPYRCFSGRLDVPTLSPGPDTVSIRITCENLLIDLRRSRERRYTHEDQQIDYPGDKGFEFVPQLQEWNGVWGRPGSGVPGYGSGNTGPQAGTVL
jgi:hypothetical protein